MNTIALIAIFISASASAESSPGFDEFFAAARYFEKACYPNDVPLVFEQCKNIMDARIAEQSTAHDKKIIELAAMEVTMTYSWGTGNDELYQMVKGDVEVQLANDVYANILTRIYSTMLYQESRYLEAYALLERSALIEKNEITHQDAARMLGDISIEMLHELQISHLKRAVALATTEQRELLFRSQLYQAIKKHRGQEVASQYSREVNMIIDYVKMANKYSKLIVLNESHRKKSPPFCTRYSFGLISAAPCRVIISNYEEALRVKNVSTEDQSRFEGYLTYAYYALETSSLASSDEIDRLRMLHK